MNSKSLWSLWGAAFGLCFPRLALGIRWYQSGIDGALSAFRADPLLWIIMTAPVFLGGLAALGGHQHDGLRAMTNELEEGAASRTHEFGAMTIRMPLILNSMSDALMTIRLDGIIDDAPQGQARRCSSH